METIGEYLRAVRAGDIILVRELLGRVDVNAGNHNGLRALHLVSKSGDLDMLKELIRNGAEVNCCTKNGNTPLHVACLAGNGVIVRYLIENTADVNVQNNDGFSPLYMAAQEGFPEIVRQLLDGNADQTMPTEHGYTPYAVALQSNHEQVVTLLKEDKNFVSLKLDKTVIECQENKLQTLKTEVPNDTWYEENSNKKVEGQKCCII